MFNPNIISEKAISMADANEELKKIQKRDKELGFRSTKTAEYFKMFQPHEKSEQIEKKLDKLAIPRLKEIHIKKLVGLMPTTADEVKLILQGYTISVTQANMKKIAETLAGFVVEKKK